MEPDELSVIREDTQYIVIVNGSVAEQTTTIESAVNYYNKVKKYFPNTKILRLEVVDPVLPKDYQPSKDTTEL